MWAQLGDVVFDILNAPDSFEASNSWDYAEHKIVGAKPKLQHTGQGLEEITLGYSLHVNYADPKASLDKLKAAAGKKEPLALVLGSGEFRGRYVISAMSETWGHTRPDGNVLSISGRITLKEHVGDTAQPLGEAQVAPGQTPAVAVKAVESAVKAWRDPNIYGEIESAAFDLQIPPVEWPGVHNTLQKASELSGWKGSTLVSGVSQVTRAASQVGATGMGGLVTSTAGLLAAGKLVRDPLQAVNMTTGFLSAAKSSPVWSAMTQKLDGDYFGAASKGLKALAGNRLDALDQYFPTSEARQMARALVTRQPVYNSLRTALLDAADRQNPLPRALFAQERSYSWMRDMVRFPTS